MPRGQFNVCAIHTRTHLARYACSDTRREGIHSCEIHVIDIDGQSFTTDDTGCLVCIDYRMHQCALRESAPIPRVLKRIACMRSAYVRARRSYTHMRAIRVHRDFCQGYNVHVRLSRSVIDDRFAVKRRNLDVEIIGSAAFSICSKLSRSRDGRPKNASIRLSNSIEWIARSTSRTHSHFNGLKLSEKCVSYGREHVIKTQ